MCDANNQAVAEDMDGIDPDDPMHSCVPTAKKLFGYDWANGYVSPFRGTNPETIEAIFNTLQNTHNNFVCYDLGCGDGRIVIEAAKRYGVKGFGIDLDENLLARARKAAIAAGVDHLVQFSCLDLMEYEVLSPSDASSSGSSSSNSDADNIVIIVYLLTGVLQRLRRKFESWILNNSNKNVTIVSVDWEVPHMGFDEEQEQQLLKFYQRSSQLQPTSLNEIISKKHYPGFFVYKRKRYL